MMLDVGVLKYANAVDAGVCSQAEQKVAEQLHALVGLLEVEKADPDTDFEEVQRLFATDRQTSTGRRQALGNAVGIFTEL